MACCRWLVALPATLRSQPTLSTGARLGGRSGDYPRYTGAWERGTSMADGKWVFTVLMEDRPFQ